MSNRLERRPHGWEARWQDDRVHRHRGRRAGGRDARADLARTGPRAGLQRPRQGRHVPDRPQRGGGGPVALRRARDAGWRREPRSAADRPRRRGVRALVLRRRQAGRGDLPRRVAADRRGRREGPHADVVAFAADRPAQRGRELGRRGGPRRRGPGELAQARRPPGVLRQARRGVLRGRARGPAPARRCDRVTRPPAAILDIDGTLVDTYYQHAVAWFRAFRLLDVTLPLYRVHRHIGMGSDQLVGALTDEDFERAHGDEVRALEGEIYMELIDEVCPLTGARELMEELRRRGHALVLASSAKQHEVDHYLDLLAARELADGWTTSADVERTKPEPDLVAAAIDKVGGADAVMVGDSTWDCEAAGRAGVATVGVLTGGFSPEELRAAGAACIFERIEDLLARLDETPLATV